MRNQHAFPTSQIADSNGMTLRDYFAAKAMEGLIASPRMPYGTVHDVTDKLIAELSYRIADAMMEAREV